MLKTTLATIFLIVTISQVQAKMTLKHGVYLSQSIHPLGDFLNPALALLEQGLKKSPIGQKLDFANHPYLCKGLLR
jgi:hypothetical protein